MCHKCFFLLLFSNCVAPVEEQTVFPSCVTCRPINFEYCVCLLSFLCSGLWNVLTAVVKCTRSVSCIMKPYGLQGEPAIIRTLYILLCDCVWKMNLAFCVSWKELESAKTLICWSEVLTRMNACCRVAVDTLSWANCERLHTFWGAVWKKFWNWKDVGVLIFTWRLKMTARAAAVKHANKVLQLSHSSKLDLPSCVLC